MRGRLFWSRGCEVKSPPSSAFGTFSPAAAGAKGLVGTLAGARKKKGVDVEILLRSAEGRRCRRRMRGRLFWSRACEVKSPPHPPSAPSPPLRRGRRVSLAHSRCAKKKGRRRRDPSPLRERGEGAAGG